MSSSTRPPDAAAGDAADARAWWLRIALVAGYLVLAHVASAADDGRWAAVALLDVVLVGLLQPLVHGRAVAWLALAAIAALLWWLSGTAFVWTVLLAVPVAFVAFIGFVFARSLRPGRVPLVTRIAAALDGVAPAALDADVRRYTRRVTLAWALLLSALAVFDLALALLGTRLQWSWFANIGDYVVIGGFMLGEFAWRRHRFPDGRHRGLFDFLRRMLSLGPAFWRSA